ncbi:MAG TPA: ABC transporter substrate-binding protein [Thermoleophilia bacterium]|nr:ABC transporter substrate-binding protein [Thermoleophilia bacterium]
MDQRQATLRPIATAARALVATALIGGVAALGFAQPAVVPIGALLDFTGPLGEFGPAHRDAAELAAAHVNAAATEVFGGPIIELVFEDAATSASIGIDRARKLVDVDGVPAIVGPLASGVAVAVAEAVTAPAGVLQISQSATSPLLTILDDDDFLFRTIGSDALQGVVAAQLARGEIFPDYAFTRAATMYVNNPYGQGLSNAFAAAFEARGGTVTAQVPHPDEPQPTYAAMLEEVFAGDPEVVLVMSYPGQATVFLTEARDLFGFTNFQYVDGSKSELIIEAMGAEAVEGRLGTAPGADPSWGGFVTFVEAFEAVYGQRPPLPFMDSIYDAVAVVGLAVAKAHVDGAQVSGAALRDNLRLIANPPGEAVGVNEFENAFRLLQSGARVAYTGAAGDVVFDEFGDVITAVEVWRYAGGTIEGLMIRTPDEIPHD